MLSPQVGLFLAPFAVTFFSFLAYQLTKSCKEMQLCKAGFNSGIVVEEPMVVSMSGCWCELRTAEGLGPQIPQACWCGWEEP